MEKEKTVKIGFFLILTFLASFFLGQVSGLFFASNFFEFWENFLEFLLNVGLRLLLAGVVFCLPSLFLRKEMLFLAVLFNCLGFFLGLWFSVGFPHWGAMVLLTILFFLGQFLFFKRVQKKANQLITFSPGEIFSPLIKGFFLTLALLFSLSFYFSISKEVAQGEFVIPETFLEKMIKPFSQIFQKSLEESLKTEVGERFGEKIGTQDPGQILKLIQEEAKETAGEGTLRQQFGLTPQIFDFEKTALPQLKERLERQIKPYLRYLPFLAAVSLFFTMRMVISFLMIFLSFLIPLAFKILLKLGVLKIIEEQKTAERITC